MSNNQIKHSVVSAVGTLVADSITYPLELISTIVKSSEKKISGTRVIMNFMKTNQFQSLYKGFSTIMFTSFFPNIAYFAVYDWSKKKTREFTKGMESSVIINTLPFFCSVAGELAFVSLMVPFDTVQTRMQMNTGKYNYKGCTNGIFQVINTEGFTRLFSASPIYAIQFLTFTPFQFTFYEYLKSFKSRKGESLSFIDCCQYSFLATALASFLTNPLSTIIVRFQIEDHSKTKITNSKRIQEIYKRSGIVQLNRGFWVRMFERNLNALCFLPIYEMTGQYFGNFHHE